MQRRVSSTAGDSLLRGSPRLLRNLIVGMTQGEDAGGTVSAGSSDGSGDAAAGCRVTDWVICVANLWLDWASFFRRGRTSVAITMVIAPEIAVVSVVGFSGSPHGLPVLTGGVWVASCLPSLIIGRDLRSEEGVKSLGSAVIIDAATPCRDSSVDGCVTGVEGLPYAQDVDAGGAVVPPGNSGVSVNSVFRVITFA